MNNVFFEDSLSTKSGKTSSSCDMYKKSFVSLNEQKELNITYPGYLNKYNAPSLPFINVIFIFLPNDDGVPMNGEL